MSKLADTQKKIEKGVVGGYKAIEKSVVSGYKSIETGVVSGYKKIEDKFVETFLTGDETKPDDSTEDAKQE
jgi:hypothetical protein